MKQLFAIVILSVLVWSQAHAQQCFPNPGPGFVSPSPNYMGGHFQNQALLAPAQAYQPQQYYFPQGNVHLSQPPMFGASMNCQPGFMNRPFQTSFGQAQMQPPSFMQTALPYLGQGISGLADYFSSRPRPSGQSYNQFLSERGSSRSRSDGGDSRIDDSAYYSPDDSGAPQTVPDSNSAGAGGAFPEEGAEEEGEDDTTTTQAQDQPEPEPEPESESESESEPEQNPEDQIAQEGDTGLDLTRDDVPPREELADPTDSNPPLPPDDGLRDAIDQIDSIPDRLENLMSREDCLEVIREQTPQRSPLHGAYRVMATFYQDCESITKILNGDTEIPNLNVSVDEDMYKIKTRQLPLEQREHYLNNHPYLKDRDFSQQADQCRDISQAPPMFSFGAKPRYRGGAGGDIDLFRDQARPGICDYSNVACDSPPVTAMDCSGFIHASLKASGLKIEKGEEHPHYSTVAFNDIAMREDSCFDELAFSAENSLSPGDIVSQSRHHMFMITGVGDDPLGIKKGLESGNCESINRDDFDFTFIQSGASKSVGVAHVSSDYDEVSETIFNNFMVMAQETCQRAQNQQGALRAVTREGRSSMVVMRHVGHSDPECSEEAPPKIEGEECVEDCLDES